MPESEKWLSLSQAAELLGVHPNTVRLWSDKGLLPVQRTQGKHRRYRRSEVELWAKTARQPRALEPESVVQHALVRMRFQIGEGHLEAQPWYQKLDNEARLQYRQSGSGLMQGLANCLASQGEEAIAEARSFGYEYASRGRRYNLSHIEAAQAFLFFRNILLQAMIAVYQETRIPTGAAWGEMLHKVHAFTDQIMLSLLETYQAFENNHR
ncbi:MAG: helix-turn-helix domain-containing protein [Anaerolineales bacterium]|nr:helix-turn-helix domain-containing protein [Anaerolineales bacterium]